MYKNGQFVKERLQTIKTKRVISPLTSRVILGGIRDGSQLSQASFPCFHEEALSLSPPGPSLFFYLRLPWRGVTYLHSTFKKHTLSLAGFSQGFNCAFFFFPSYLSQLGSSLLLRACCLQKALFSFFSQLCPWRERWSVVGRPALLWLVSKFPHSEVCWTGALVYTWPPSWPASLSGTDVSLVSSLLLVLFIYLFSGEEGCYLLETVLETIPYGSLLTQMLHEQSVPIELNSLLRTWMYKTELINMGY